MKKLIFPILGFSMAVLCHQSAIAASQTTVRFQLPEASIDTTKTYAKEEFFSATTGYRSTTTWSYKPSFRNWEKTFSEGSDINSYFVDEIVAKKEAAETEFRAGVLANSKVRSLHYAEIIQDPMKVVLGVRGNKVIFELSGLKFRTKVDAHTEGTLENLLCGSTIVGTASANIEAYGEYDVNSGIATLTKVDLNESVDVDCSSAFGQIFDGIIDLGVDYFVGGEVAGLVDSILKENKYIGGFENLFSDEVIQAGNALNFDIAANAWQALSKYVDGVTLEFNFGIDQFGADKHLISFGAYQESVEVGLSTSRSSAYNISYSATMECPSWADEMVAYEGVPVVIKSTGRFGAVKTYGQKFRKLNISGTNYSHSLGSLTRTKNTTESAGTLVFACKSPNGLTSMFSATKNWPGRTEASVGAGGQPPY